jgi:hypothetical protein
VALPFTAPAATQILVLIISAKVMVNYDNFSNIIEIPEQGCYAFAGHISAVPSSSTRTTNVKHGRQTSTLIARSLLGCLDACGQL